MYPKLNLIGVENKFVGTHLFFLYQIELKMTRTFSN